MKVLQRSQAPLNDKIAAPEYHGRSRKCFSEKSRYLLKSRTEPLQPRNMSKTLQVQKQAMIHLRWIATILKNLKSKVSLFLSILEPKVQQKMADKRASLTNDLLEGVYSNIKASTSGKKSRLGDLTMFRVNFIDEKRKDKVTDQENDRLWGHQ